MKEYLFLYPINEFVDGCIKVGGIDPQDPRIDSLNQIIDARYRQSDYHINWLLFNKRRHVQLADRKRISPYLKILPQDSILHCGVTFLDMGCFQYPNPHYILSQLSKPVDRLVLGGFHQSDCVDKLAASAHRRGIKVFIDEETTDNFFAFLGTNKVIPLTRKNEVTLADLGIIGEEAERVKRKRESKPWFTQK